MGGHFLLEDEIGEASSCFLPDARELRKFEDEPETGS